MPGILYIVATPIGHLGDITHRALEVLQSVDCIAAEDTRHSKRLLTEYNIKTPLISYHHFNEATRQALLIERLLQGENIALISDAGTPLISDPGHHLVRAAKEAEITVCPIPGPCALISALCASGLSTESFTFLGFLPVKPGPRREMLSPFLELPQTVILYEAPHRILDLMALLLECLSENRQVVLAKELTKTFETIRKGSAAELNAWLASDSNHTRGEFVVLIEGKANLQTGNIAPETIKLLTCLLDELPLKHAVSLASKITGEKKNHLYEFALTIKQD